MNISGRMLLTALVALALASPARADLSAEQVRTSIERAVSRETGGKVRNLRVEVNRAGILLSGRCTTYYTKQKAQHAAMALSGSDPLTNEIEVS